MLQRWLSAPHVAVWLNDCVDLNSVEAKYGPRIDGADPTLLFVITHEGKPIGWIQWYLWADYPEHAQQLGAESNSAGIDLAIGELEMTGLGLGSAIIRAFLDHFVFTDSSIRTILTDPEENNIRSLRAFKKAGFQVINTVRLAGESRQRHVLRLDHEWG